MRRILAVVLALATVTTARAGTLRVRVLDADGQPAAGVPLEVRSALLGGKVPAGSATTGADGIATFEDAERWYSPDVRAQVPQVEVNLPLGLEVSFSLLQKSIPSEPLVLRLPSGPALRIHLLWPQQAAPASRTLVLTWMDPARGVQRSSRFSGLTATVSDLKFPAVAWFHPIDALVLDEDGVQVTSTSIEPLGKEAHERVAELVPLRDWVVVRSRVLDERGQPLTNHAIDLRSLDDRDLYHPHASRTVRDVPTDAGGRFEVFFDLTKPTRSAAASVPSQLGSLIVTVQGKDQSEVRADVANGLGPTADGVIRLLDVQLRRRAVIANGIVQDLTGKPIAGAWIRPLVPNGPRRSSHTSFLPEHDWITDDSGRFQLIEASAQADELQRLVVTAKDRHARIVELGSHTTKDLVVSMAETIEISGRMLAPEGTDPATLRVDVDYVDGAVPWIGHDQARSVGSTARWAAVDATGHFAIRDVWPGVALLRVPGAAGRAPFASDRMRITERGIEGELVLDLRAPPK